jgi:hypothetical protein
MRCRNAKSIFAVIKLFTLLWSMPIIFRQCFCKSHKGILYAIGRTKFMLRTGIDKGCSFLGINSID